MSDPGGRQDQLGVGRDLDFPGPTPPRLVRLSRRTSASSSSDTTTVRAVAMVPSRRKISTLSSLKAT